MDIQAEIIELHAFFEDYFNGTLPVEAITQFEATLAPEFHIISDNGHILGRDAILEAVSSGHNQRDNMKIWIENVQIRQHIDDIVIATYEEWQNIGGATTKRTSTVIFHVDRARPHGLHWLHVHESGLQTLDQS